MQDAACMLEGVSQSELANLTPANKKLVRRLSEACQVLIKKSSATAACSKQVVVGFSPSAP